MPAHIVTKYQSLLVLVRVMLRIPGFILGGLFLR